MRRFFLSFVPAVVFLSAGQSASGAVPGLACGRILMTVDTRGDEGTRVESIKPSGDARRLISDFAGGINEVLASPDGQFLVTSVYIDDERQADLILVRADGSERRRITKGSGYDWRMSWAPDSSRLVFQRGLDARDSEIIVLELDSREETVIAQGSDPAWSPVGDLIAYSRDSAGAADLTLDIVTVDPQGNGVTYITEDPASHDGEPEWSPDGEEVAFLRTPLAQENQNEGPYADIWRVSSAGGDEFQVTHQQDDLNGVYGQRWSPDGSKLAYVFENDGGSWIHTINVDGTKHRRVTSSFQKFSFEPSWSPDGARLAFVQYGAKGSEVWKARPNGDGEKKQVTRSPNLFESSADWVGCT